MKDVFDAVKVGPEEEEGGVVCVRVFLCVRLVQVVMCCRDRLLTIDSTVPSA